MTQWNRSGNRHGAGRHRTHTGLCQAAEIPVPDAETGAPGLMLARQPAGGFAVVWKFLASQPPLALVRRGITSPHIGRVAQKPPLSMYCSVQSTPKKPPLRTALGGDSPARNEFRNEKTGVRCDTERSAHADHFAMAERNRIPRSLDWISIVKGGRRVRKHPATVFFYSEGGGTTMMVLPSPLRPVAPVSPVSPCAPVYPGSPC